jgi:3-methyl-2-oxobutanoate hydroxymethyltransferase
MPRYSLSDLKKKLNNNEKLVSIALYGKNMAEIADDYTDIILVGDSLGMTLYGMESTLPVNLEMMLEHGKTVVNATQKSFITIDMNFGSYQISKEQAFTNAAKIISYTGANAIKLEGGSVFADTVKFITERGIAVLGHAGLLPQSFNQLGGYKIQGNNQSSSKKIINDVIALEQAGCFAVVIEGVKADLIEKIKEKSKIPLIGIGANNICEGQILVADDLIGLSKNQPKFAKKYANIRHDVNMAINQYATEVRNGKFPDKNHIY